jgi:hypothetical protein|tara:strand:- start:7 stop:381 length:375 start_codon:yes stop_codon:yes gene_type:complete
MALYRVVMRLTRNPGTSFPDGDDHRGYTIVAPLDASGHLDLKLWRENKEKCIVLRFSPEEDEKADGWLTHRGSHWYFRYDEEDEGPDEPVFRLGDHALRKGEYITIHEADGEDLTHKITDVVKV